MSDPVFDYASQTFVTNATVSGERLLQLASPNEDRATQLLDGRDAAEVLTQLGIQVDDAVLVPMEISSNRIDSYFTHMHPTTLNNFAQGARDGVSFLDSHDFTKLGIGYSLSGSVEDQGDVVRTLADFYTVRGIRFGGQHSFASTDDLIRALFARIVRDVSVGFSGGEYTCDLCGRDYLSWDCPHFAGVSYEIEGEGGAVSRVATVEIHNAHLCEVSAVFDGATPGATIFKAEEAARSGLLDDHVARTIERRFRVSLPDKVIKSPGVTLEENRMNKKDEETRNPIEDAPKSEVPSMTTRKDDPIKSDSLEEIREKIRATGIEWDGNDVLAAIDALVAGRVSAESALAAAEKRIKALEPMADMGKQYREALIEETVKEGVRAMGDAFPVETYRGMLDGAEIDTIRAMVDAFKKQADSAIPTGRQVEENDGSEGEGTAETDLTPAAAYRGS